MQKLTTYSHLRCNKYFNLWGSLINVILQLFLSRLQCQLQESRFLSHSHCVLPRSRAEWDTNVSVFSQRHPVCSFSHSTSQNRKQGYQTARWPDNLVTWNHPISQAWRNTTLNTWNIYNVSSYFIKLNDSIYVCVKLGIHLCAILLKATHKRTRKTVFQQDFWLSSTKAVKSHNS